MAAKAQKRAAGSLHARNFRCAELALISPDGRSIEFRLQRELKNFNSGFGGGNRNAHWSQKHAQRVAWQMAMCNALVAAVGMRRAQQMLVFDSGLFGACGERCQVRRRIEIRRLVPSRRRFIRDTFENLPWAAKELRDAIKGLGLIYDDSDAWTDTTITQGLSTDGTCWTEILINDTDGATPPIKEPHART